MPGRKFAYRIVDVFTDRVFGGNALAVFLDGRGISDREMQSIAKEMNLSETTFVLPPDNSAHQFKVRIFTPGRELPMAGHPTIGTAFVLAREGAIPLSGDEANVIFEELVGPIPVRLRGVHGRVDMIWMTQPSPKFGAIFDNRALAAEMLSLETSALDPTLPLQVVSCGVPFLFIPVKDLASMRRLRFREHVAAHALDELGVHEVFLFSREVENPGSTVHSRMFAPGLGVVEDPATGGASGPLGCYLVRHGVVAAEPTAAIISEQGIEMGRPSFIHIEITASAGEISRVNVGGRAVFVGAGELTLPDNAESA